MGVQITYKSGAVFPRAPIWVLYAAAALAWAVGFSIDRSIRIRIVIEDPYDSDRSIEKSTADSDAAAAKPVKSSQITKAIRNRS